MYLLVDRSNGELVGQLTEQDFTLLQSTLVRESEQDFDYYVQQGSLDLLTEAGMSQATIEAIESRLTGRGLDLGWETLHETNEVGYSGEVVDREGGPVGGIRVDLIAASSIVGWTYTTPDGTFQAYPNPGHEGQKVNSLRFTGRGDLVLEQASIDSDGEQGTFEIQTLTGSVRTENGQPLAGVSVQLNQWRAMSGKSSKSRPPLGGSQSWGDTDVEGNFVIPVRLPDDVRSIEVELELFAASGENLRHVRIKLEPGLSLRLKELVVPTPDPEWGDSARVVPPVETSVVMYPGVSENPLR